MVDRFANVTRTIFFKDLKELLRDRRAVVFAFLVPLLLYPILFFIVSILPRVRSAELESLQLEVGVTGNFPYANRFLQQEGLQVSEFEDPTAAIRSETLTVAVAFYRAIEKQESENENQDGAGADGPDDTQSPQDSSDGDNRNYDVPLEAVLRGEINLAVEVSYLGTSRKSFEGRERVASALKSLRENLLTMRFSPYGHDRDPLQLTHRIVRDVATKSEAASAKFGRLLPVLVVLLLLTGGSFAAIDLVAGEKERGTLETLYLHPVPTGAIVTAKLLVVLATSLVSVSLNYAGMVVGVKLCSWLSLNIEDQTAFPVFVPPIGVALQILLLLLPLAVFTSSLLLAVSTRSNSFREAQTYLLPLTLICMVCIGLGLAPQLSLASVVALVPIANVTLGMREALEGRLEAVPYLVTLAFSTLYAWLTLRFAAKLLHREEVVLGIEPPVGMLRQDPEHRARRVLLFGCFALLGVYYVGQLLQSWNLVGGLALTLWVVVLAPPIAYLIYFQLPVREVLGWRATRLRNYLWMVPISLGTTVVVVAYTSLQRRFLPMPTFGAELIAETFRNLGYPLAILLVAVSPAVCEEILWRGTFQGELSQRQRPLRTALVVAFFFGLFHLSIERLIPTALAGFALAMVRERSGSIFPAMILHGLYNFTALTLIHHMPPEREESLTRLASQPLVWGGALVIVAFGISQLRGPLAAEGGGPDRTE